MQKVAGEPDLVRDENGVIHNANNNAYHQYMIKKRTVLETKQRMDKLESENKEIKEKLDLILKLLKDDNK